MGSRGVTAPLRNRNFRWFYVGEAVNTAGSSMSGIALAFAALQINDSASALGVVVAAFSVPMVGFMLIGGALADRLPRALVLRGGNLVQGVVQSSVALLVLTDTAEIWHLVVLSFISGTVVAVTYPAFHGMVPILVPPDDRKPAYVLMGQTDSLLHIAGPAAAGILVAATSPGWALAFDAATYFAAAGFLVLVKIPFGERPERQASVIGDFRVGWSFARSLGWVIPASCCALVFNALNSGAIGVLGPVIAKNTIGSEGFGIARSAEAVGLFVTGFFLVHLTIRRPMHAIMVGFFALASPMVVLAITPLSTVALAFAFLVAGVGLAVLSLAWSLTVQEKVPEEMLSRIMAIDGFFSFIAMPVGQLLVGPLVLLISIRSVELGSFVLSGVVMVIALATPAIASLRLEGVTPDTKEPATN